MLRLGDLTHVSPSRVGLCGASVSSTNNVHPITNDPLTAKAEKMIFHASVSGVRSCSLRNGSRFIARFIAGLPRETPN